MNHEHVSEEIPAPPTEPAAELVWTQLLNRLQAAPVPESAEARLRRIRNAIARGQFHVNARTIADRLIARLLQT